MEEVKYIPVREFAERAKISRQSLYKAYSNPKSKIYPYVQVKPKGIYISTQALIDLYDNPEQAEATARNNGEHPNPAPQAMADKESVVETNNGAQPTDTEKQPEKPPVVPMESQLYTAYITHLEAEVKRLTEEKEALRQTNQKQQEQIIDLSNKVMEISNQAFIIAKQEQHLTYLDKAPDRPEEAPAPKRSLLKRLLGMD